MLKKIKGVNLVTESTKRMTEIANRNFGIWNNALQTRNPKEVAALYMADTTFLPTVSGEFKKGQEGAEEYFQHFLEKNPTGEVIQEEVQTLGADCYLHSGIYNFKVGPDDDRQVVEARFSFYENLRLIITPIVLLGLLIDWKWEKIAGYMICIPTGIGLLFALIMRGNPSSIVLLLAIPGGLYLYYGYKKRQ